MTECVCVICGRRFQGSRASCKYCSAECSRVAHRSTALAWAHRHSPIKCGDRIPRAISRDPAKPFAVIDPERALTPRALRLARLAAGCTYQMLYDRSGISTSWLTYFETGRARMGTGDYAKIDAALGGMLHRIQAVEAMIYNEED